MPPPLQIVVTCTKRKTQPIPAALKVRSLRKDTVLRRSAQWIDRLSTVKGNRIAAGDIYCGDHWQTVKALAPAAQAAGYKANIWICSAGYGLLSLDCKILPYSATFAPTHPDSVCQRVTGSKTESLPQSWWRLLSEWPGPALSMPRRLADIPLAYPRSAIWIVASEIYLDAIADDVRALAAQLRDREHLTLFSAGTKTLAGLSEHLLPLGAELQGMAGGALRSLNIRLARHAALKLDKIGTDYSSLKNAFEKLRASQPTPVVPVRARLSDQNLEQFILTALRENPRKAFSPLLRELRAQGFACESSRFASLYQGIQDRIHDS